MYGVPWTDEDVRKLVDLHKNGATVRDIANALKCNEGRIRNKCRVLGLKFPKPNAWTSDEFEMLKSMAEDKKAAFEIASALGRTTSAVIAMSSKNSIYLTTAFECDNRPARDNTPWTRNDEKNLYIMFENGHSVDEMAKSLERSPSAIRVRMVQLGLRLRDR